jgi:PKD repeat protein
MLKHFTRRSLLPALAAVLLLGGAIPAAAGADSFGELSRFGSAGVGAGQFKEAGPETVAFGVDPTDNSVYVGDKPSAHVARIQKLSETGQFLGAATLEVKGEETAIEGVAIDPSLHRFYVLVVQTRGSNLAIDPEITAAADLYAFSTEVTEKEGQKVLEPAVTGGVLVSKAVLRPQSAVLGQALLEPSGLTVDPKSGDIILMGRQDLGEGVEEPSLRVALERFSSAGVFKVRWVDEASSPFFEEESPTSPVVTNEGKVYVIGGALIGGGEFGVEQIDEIPKSFASSEQPKAFINYDSGASELVTFPGLPEPLEGGGLSLAPDGTLWVYAKILTVGETENFKNPGALSFTPTGAVHGWTGGQTLKLGTGKCTISFFGHPMVAAGSGEQLFMFDSNPEAPHVVRFGPGGAGCPTAKASPLGAAVGARKIESADVIAPGSEVKLTSSISEANALKVEWNFGDKSELVTSNQHQSLEALHRFTSEGEFTVKATIKTDNLAMPTIVLERTLTVSKPLPIAKFSATNPVQVGQVDTFDTKGSSGSEESAITEYKWEFGDGSAAVATTTPSTTHAFGAAGEYTVTLRVTDAQKRTSKPVSMGIIVNAPTGGPTTTTTTTTNPSPPPPRETGGVLPYQIGLAGTTFSSSKSGALAIKINCAGQSSCTGNLTLKTASAVSAAKHKKKAILTLATGSFKVLGGHVQSVTLHLSASARTLLAHSGSRGLRVRLTIVARDSAGQSHTTSALVTIHAAKVKHH